VRRLLWLVNSIVAVDTMFFAALTPLLDHYSHRYGLSKSEAGILVATYAAGALVSAFPAGFAATHWGPKAAVLAGIGLMAVSSLAFAFAGNAWMLGLSRFVQGIGSAFSWSGALSWLVAATPKGRRGEVLGGAMGAAVFGALLGPVIGALAGVVGSRAAFSGVAVLGAGVFCWALTTPGAPAERQSFADVRRAVTEQRLFAGFWLIFLPAVLFSVLVVLVPLRLGHFGWGPVAIGSVFLAMTALETVVNPLVGRFADRRGVLLPVRAGLVGSVLVSLALAWAGRAIEIVPLVLFAGVAYSLFFTPALAIISSAAGRSGVAQGLAFGVMNACWAVGAVLGPALGGKLAQSAGDSVPYIGLALLCLATPLVARRAAIAAP
jgi:MFS family permease